MPLYKLDASISSRFNGEITQCLLLWDLWDRQAGNFTGSPLLNQPFKRSTNKPALVERQGRKGKAHLLTCEVLSTTSEAHQESSLRKNQWGLTQALIEAAATSNDPATKQALDTQVRNIILESKTPTLSTGARLGD